jgi:hypothetical protein
VRGQGHARGLAPFIDERAAQVSKVATQKGAFAFHLFGRVRRTGDAKPQVRAFFLGEVTTAGGGEAASRIFARCASPRSALLGHSGRGAAFGFFRCAGRHAGEVAKGVPDRTEDDARLFAVTIMTSFMIDTPIEEFVEFS